MLLQGQTAELYSCKFSPSGEHVASAGAEKSIYLWNTYGDCDNFGVIKGHIGTILELHWSRDGSMIFTASADKTCGVFDVQTGERIKRFKGHTSFVNSCSPARRGPELLASGSDDGSVK
ncbi:U5 small nuclear ribonucleoprotein, partial [Haplosporangium bisporale]